MSYKTWPLILAAGLAACGGREPEAAPALSSGNANPFSAHVQKAKSGVVQAFRFLSEAWNAAPLPETEASASKGPIELSLFLHKERIKVGDHFWHQIRIRNIGEREILISDRVFRDSARIDDNFYNKFGIYIEGFGPNGVALGKEGGRGCGLDWSSGDWWPKTALNDILVFFELKKNRYDLEQERDSGFWLQPGEKLDTKSSFDYSNRERAKQRPPPQPRGEFSRLEIFDIEKPGLYKFRAVFDQDWSRRYGLRNREIGPARHSTNIRVRTPWI